MISSAVKTSTVVENDLDKKLEIKADALDLPAGVTTNAISCPWCKRSGSFSVSRTLRGDLLFLCHRSACDNSGYIRDRGTGGIAPAERKFVPRVFDYPTARLEGDKLSKLLGTYRLTTAEIRWAEWTYCPKTDRLVMPVLSPTGQGRGFVARAFNPADTHKNITYKEVDDVWMAWYLRPQVAIPNTQGFLNQVIIVEDMVSALKASRFYPTVALLGTHMNHSMLSEIVALTTNITICLDRDATEKAHKYTEQFAVYGNFRTVPLSKDVKDMTDEELVEWSELL